MLKKLMLLVTLAAAAGMLAPNAVAREHAYLFVGQGQQMAMIPGDGSWVSAGMVGPIMAPEGAQCVVTASWTGVKGANVYDVTLNTSPNSRGPWIQRYENMMATASGAITNSFVTPGGPITFYVSARNYQGDMPWNLELTRISAVCARSFPAEDGDTESGFAPVPLKDGETVN